MSKIHPNTLITYKKEQKKITMLTAYDALTASLLDEAGIDVILIGDSLGNVFAGHQNTLPVTLDHMVYHTQAVSRATSRALILADMPFMSYHITPKQAKTNAGRLIQEAGAGAVKMEVAPGTIKAIAEVIKIGIPVMGHIGLTPQSIHQLGGYKIQGKTNEAAEELKKQIKTLESIGCFAVLLELMPTQVAKMLTDSVKIPTIGIGAGPHCDGQVLVTQDLLGLTPTHPKFVKTYTNQRKDTLNAIKNYIQDTQKNTFPNTENSYI
jgi:3-methyl-2-oxobutanoate hydroxymethyltransferase